MAIYLFIITTIIIVQTTALLMSSVLLLFPMNWSTDDIRDVCSNTSDVYNMGKIDYMMVD